MADEKKEAFYVKLGETPSIYWDPVERVKVVGNVVVEVKNTPAIKLAIKNDRLVKSNKTEFDKYVKSVSADKAKQTANDNTVKELLKKEERKNADLIGKVNNLDSINKDLNFFLDDLLDADSKELGGKLSAIRKAREDSANGTGKTSK